MDRINHRLNAVIERFIDVYDGTAIGWEVRCMYETRISYEYICERMGINYSDYEEG